ncbi:MAG: hypothetical protein GX608_03725 [Lentisphaerae bacterium]|nr:hypothetical protein [Lentisphaerota bacterium]
MPLIGAGHIPAVAGPLPCNLPHHLPNAFASKKTLKRNGIRKQDNANFWSVNPVSGLFLHGRRCRAGKPYSGF